MEEINRPRFKRSIVLALKDLEREAFCYGYLDDPEYLRVKEFLEKSIEKREKYYDNL